MLTICSCQLCRLLWTRLARHIAPQLPTLVRHSTAQHSTAANCTEQTNQIQKNNRTHLMGSMTRHDCTLAPPPSPRPRCSRTSQKKATAAPVAACGSVCVHAHVIARCAGHIIRIRASPSAYFSGIGFSPAAASDQFETVSVPFILFTQPGVAYRIELL